jgi:hypothetical protein
VLEESDLEQPHRDRCLALSIDFWFETALTIKSATKPIAIGHTIKSNAAADARTGQRTSKSGS